jgi:hypothetical protein
LINFPLAGSAGPGFHNWPGSADVLVGEYETGDSHSKKTFGEAFGAATGVSDPRLQKSDPKQRRRRLKKNWDTHFCYRLGEQMSGCLRLGRDWVAAMRTTRTPALPQRGLDTWMIFWTIVHMVLFGYFCGLSARVLAVFWLDGITFCGLFPYWRLDACVVSPADRHLSAVPAHLS